MVTNTNMANSNTDLAFKSVFKTSHFRRDQDGHRLKQCRSADEMDTHVYQMLDKQKSK